MKPIELLFPRLRSGHRLFQRPSRQKQIPSSNLSLYHQLSEEKVASRMDGTGRSQSTIRSIMWYRDGLSWESFHGARILAALSSLLCPFFRTCRVLFFAFCPSLNYHYATRHYYASPSPSPSSCHSMTRAALFSRGSGDRLVEIREIAPPCAPCRPRQPWFTFMNCVSRTAEPPEPPEPPGPRAQAGPDLQPAAENCPIQPTTALTQQP